MLSFHSRHAFSLLTLLKFGDLRRNGPCMDEPLLPCASTHSIVLSDHLVGFVQAGSARTRSTRAMNDSINLHARRTARSFKFMHAKVHAAARAYYGLMCTQPGMG
jgi:hypothetical protein